MSNLIIKNATVIDPKTSTEEVKDVFINDGVFAEKADPKAKVIDAKNLHLFPGFIDAHAHLRDPGQTSKETIATGTKAAAAGGFTAILAMPNTNPKIDSTSSMKLVNELIASSAYIRVFQSACITENSEGKKLAPIGTLKNAGAITITDDGSCLQNNDLMRRALEYANMFDLLVMDHCQDASMTARAQMNEGIMSAQLGLEGWPRAAEDIIVSRDIILSKYANARVHLQHISSAFSVEMIRGAKNRGIKISAEATPHHIALNDSMLSNFDTNYKMNPPLRTDDDRNEIIKGLCDGTIDIIATDHAPHSLSDKDVEFDYAPCGIIGFETAFPVCYETLVLNGSMKLMRLIELFTSAPAKLLNISGGSLAIGEQADFVLADLNAEFLYNKTFSKSSNSPWLGKKLKSKILATYYRGREVFNDSERA